MQIVTELSLFREETMTVHSIGDEVLSGWTIVRLIGEGAFGRVYEVQKAGHGMASQPST